MLTVSRVSGSEISNLVMYSWEMSNLVIYTLERSIATVSRVEHYRIFFYRAYLAN